MSAQATGVRRGLGALLGDLNRLIMEFRALPMTRLETLDVEALESLLNLLRALLQESDETVGWLERDPRLARDPAAQQHFEAIAWAFGWEIQKAQGVLESFAKGGVGREVLDSVATASLSGLIAIRDVVASVTTDLSGVATTPDLAGEAVRARRFLASIARRVEEIEEPTEEGMRTVRRIGAVLAWAIGHDNFDRLRAADRLAIRKLQDRAVGWFDGDATKRTAFELWSDLQAFTILVNEISSTPAIREHDRRMLAELRGLLAGLTAGAPAPPGLSAHLSALSGLSRELDEWSRNGEHASEGLLEIVQRLKHRLATDESGF